MKKWIAGFLTVLLLLLLAACGTGSAGTGGSTQAIQPLYADELTDEKRAELIEALKQNDFIRSTAETVPGKGDEIIAGWDYYYTGTYNGYDTFFYMTIFFGGWSAKLGEEFFWSEVTGGILVHRDGELTTLEDVYYRIPGAISDEDLHTLAQRYFDLRMEYLYEPVIELTYEEYGYLDRYTSGK